MGNCVKKNVFTFTLLNARSLKNKLESLKETMNELGTDVCAIVETWFKPADPSIKMLLEDFKHKNGYEFLRKDRQSMRRGGGIAICFNTNRICLCKAKIPPTKHEVYAAVGRRMGQRRKVVVLVIYVPPWYNAEQNRSLFNYTNDALLALSNKYDNPYFVVAGDFNRRDFNQATREYPQIKSILTGPTRNDAVLDIIGSNMNDSIIDKGVVAPIISNDEVESDHSTVFCQFRMPRVPSYSVQSYTYKHLTEESHEAFGNWIANNNWEAVLESKDPDSAVETLHEEFEKGINASYKTITRNKKSSEPAWMSDWLRDEIEDRRKVFKTDQKRSNRWKALKDKISRSVRKRKKKHNEFILDKFNNESNPGKFFHHLQCLLSNNNKEMWSPMSMYPGQSKSEVAEKVADFFNDISSQFEPLDITKVPTTFEANLPKLTTEQVIDRLKKAKKPTSSVPGDIPSVLYNKFVNKLAGPIAHIFNLITEHSTWPTLWKIEYVTVIPKTPDPQHPSECRNISCTNFLSKVYESFLLEWSRREVRPKINQYGGEKGASSTQLLIEVVSDVTEALEDNRAGMVLSAIDFSKAFNRLDHHKCLQAFANKGASNQILRLLASFLHKRQMTVRIGGEMSNPRYVNAGAPQGSVLGCYLFNIGIGRLCQY